MSAGGRPCSGGVGEEPLPGPLWGAVSIGQWDAERLSGEARAILGVAGLILTVMAVGLIGFAEAFGADPGSLASLDRLFLGNLAAVLLLGIVGMSGVVASVFCATLALRGIGGGSVSDYRSLAVLDGGRVEPDGAVPDSFGKAALEGRRAPYGAYVRRLDALSESNRRAARYIRLGRVYMSYGLAAIFVTSAVIIVGTFYSLELAKISAAADAALMCLDAEPHEQMPSMLAKLWTEGNPPLAEWPGAHSGALAHE